MITRKKNFVLCCNNFLVTRLATWEGVRLLSAACGSLLAVGMIWRLQWSGTCNDIVNTLQPTCHQLSSTNGSPVKSVISQSEVRRQKPAVTCEEESFQGCNAATNPTLHIFLLTFGHFMPFYCSVPAMNTWPLWAGDTNILCTGGVIGSLPLIQPSALQACTDLYPDPTITEYAHFIWILINSPPRQSPHMFCFGSRCAITSCQYQYLLGLRLGLWLHHYELWVHNVTVRVGSCHFTPHPWLDGDKIGSIRISWSTVHCWSQLQCYRVQGIRESHDLKINLARDVSRDGGGAAATCNYEHNRLCHCIQIIMNPAIVCRNTGPVSGTWIHRRKYLSFNCWH